MKKRPIRILLAVVMILGLGASGFAWLRAGPGNREELYWGHPAGYWAEQLNSRPGASNTAIAVLDTEIIPRLTTTLLNDMSDSEVRLRLVKSLNELPGISLRFVPARDRRRAAAFNLGSFGPASHAAVPALIQSLNSPDDPVRGGAAAALGKIHSQPDVVIPLLMKYLDDGDLAEAAAGALGDFGAAARAAVPKLVPLLKANDPGLQTTVGRALKKIDPQAATAAVK